MRRWLLKLLCRLRIYPSAFFTLSPFKTYEYRELTRDDPLSGTETIVDLGCGRGLQSVLLAQRARRVIGIDIAERDCARGRRLVSYLEGRVNCEFWCTRLEHAGLPSGSVDRVYSFSVIEHIDNSEEVLREVHRILKPRGRFILSTDSLDAITDPLIRDLHREKYSVCRYYAEGSLRDALRNAGFHNIHISPIFQSSLAKSYFIRTIISYFPYGHLHSIYTYALLRLAETQAPRNSPGIFLVAKAEK